MDYILICAVLFFVALLLFEVSLAFGLYLIGTVMEVCRDIRRW